MHEVQGQAQEPDPRDVSVFLHGLRQVCWLCRAFVSGVPEGRLRGAVLSVAAAEEVYL